MIKCENYVQYNGSGICRYQNRVGEIISVVCYAESFQPEQMQKKADSCPNKECIRNERRHLGVLRRVGLDTITEQAALALGI